jgi:hypothetical protein
MTSAPIFIVTLVLALAGCSTPTSPEPARYAPAKPVDLAGSWEIDHARSDNIQQQFNAIARQLQREAERRARAAERGQAVSPAAMTSGRDLYALAEMAELITAPTLLDVVQTDSEVRLKRENSFALICRTDRPAPVISVTAFGEERCGWDGHQLFFDISLPDGLSIRHRISRSALADFLVVQTAVYSPVVREPFTVRKVFNRYDPAKAGYRCTQTLSKGLVCTTEARKR